MHYRILLHSVNVNNYCSFLCWNAAKQIHEMAMVSAVQEAQKDNLKNFNDYMMKVLEVSLPSCFSYDELCGVSC